MAIVNIPRRLCKKAPTTFYLALIVIHIGFSIYDIFILKDRQMSFHNLILALWLWFAYDNGKRLNRLIDFIVENSMSHDIEQQKKVDELYGRNK